MDYRVGDCDVGYGIFGTGFGGGEECGEDGGGGLLLLGVVWLDCG